MPVTSKPAQGHTNWTDGNPLKVQDPGPGKKLTGWVVEDIPPFEFENWLEWTLDQWDQYFEYITDLHTTQIAALTATVATLGTATAISASNAGHTVLTGVTVQAQLNQTDTALKDLFDAITSGEGIDLVGYVPAIPGNWSPAPTHAGPALDQLAARTQALEVAGAGQDFIDRTFNDYVIPAYKPIAGFPNGIGNPGLTDNGTTNPRGVKLSELQTKWGEEKIYFHSMKQTGRYDSSGLEEWALVAPKHDARVMFYGNWHNDEESAIGVQQGEQVQQNKGQYFRAKESNCYFLVTAVCDGICPIVVVQTDSANQIQVSIDNVNTGSPISQRGQGNLQNAHGQIDQMVGDLSLVNIGYGLHTFKFANGSTDANSVMRWCGVSLITTGQKELGGAMYLSKALSTYSPASISAPSVGGKGGKIIRYIDPSDTLRKDAVQNTLEVNTAVTGSVGSGTTSLGVNSAAGWVSNSIAEISDGPTNMELILVTAVNLISNVLTLAGGGTVNSYTNPTVKLYAKTMASTDHSNEQEKFTNHVQAFSSGQRDFQGSDQPAWIGGYTGYNIVQGWTQDGVYGFAMSSGRALGNGNLASPARHTQIMTMNGNTNTLHIDARTTGFDILFEQANGAETAILDVYLDGVKISTLTFISPATTGPFWKKFASDLPEGSHRLSFFCTAGGSATCNQVGFVSVKLYEAKDPAAIATIPRGDLLSKRVKLADYLFNPDFRFPSKGILKQHIAQNSFFGSVNPANTGIWTESTYDVTNGLGGAPDWVEFQTSTTDDCFKKWFYCTAGGGFEALMLKVSNQGICEFKIDGNLATAANFPGMTFQGGSGGYNTATGLYDAYDVSATNVYQKLSFAGLAEGWHEVQIRCTGTKNVSSSNYYLFIHRVDIIGAVMSDDIFNSSTLITSSVSRGGAKDLRVMESYNSENLETPADICAAVGPIVFGGAGIYYGLNQLIGCFETSGGDVEVALKINGANSGGAGAIQSGFEIDGINYPYEIAYHAAANWLTEMISVMKIPMAPGRHFIRPWLLGNTGNTVNQEASLVIKEMPKRRAT